jgi:hypothetical protein
MTPQEITAWIGGLAAKSDRLEALLAAQIAAQQAVNAAHVARMAEHDARLEVERAATAKRFAENAAQTKIADEKFRAEMNELRLLGAETRRALNDAVRQGEETAFMFENTFLEVEKTQVDDESVALEVEKISLAVDETTRVVEERRAAKAYFFNSLTVDPRLGDIEFDSVTPNLRFSYKGGHNEFDIVMVNGRSVALIEVQRKAHVSDLTQVAAQVERYRRWRPEHRDYDIYCGLAAFSVPQDVHDEALEKGLFVLQRNGGVFQADAQGMRAL